MEATHLGRVTFGVFPVQTDHFPTGRLVENTGQQVTLMMVFRKLKSLLLLFFMGTLPFCSLSGGRIGADGRASVPAQPS